jgi:hypothetical protein
MELHDGCFSIGFFHFSCYPSTAILGHGIVLHSFFVAELCTHTPMYICMYSLVVLGWTQGLALARQGLYHFSHSTNPFCFNYYLNKVPCLYLGNLDHSLPIYTFHIDGITGTHHSAQLFKKLLLLRGISQTFCPSWPQTMIFLISASWVARITGVSHWACLVAE